MTRVKTIADLFLGVGMIALIVGFVLAVIKIAQVLSLAFKLPY